MAGAHVFAHLACISSSSRARSMQY